MARKAAKQFYPAQTTTVRQVTANPTALAGYYIYNPSNATAYVQFFDLSTTVTLGTTVPDLSLGIPSGGAANLMSDEGIEFDHGMQLAATTTATGNTAPNVGLDINVFYHA